MLQFAFKNNSIFWQRFLKILGSWQNFSSGEKKKKISILSFQGLEIPENLTVSRI